jgi:cephalosporin hydroxylase
MVRAVPYARTINLQKAIAEMSVDDKNDQLVREANIAYFKTQPYKNMHWMGIPIAKCPMDLWIYQELITKHDIDLIVETGTFKGGSALYFANLFDIRGKGRVVSVDIRQPDDFPRHDRIQYVTGRSCSGEALSRVSEAVSRATNVLVILDSDHTKTHTYFELRMYSPFVSVGSYIIAEDSSFDYYPCWPEYGPGPYAATAQFLNETNEFEVDRSLEVHMISFAPGAFLKRVKAV